MTLRQRLVRNLNLETIEVTGVDGEMWEGVCKQMKGKLDLQGGGVQGSLEDQANRYRRMEAIQSISSFVAPDIGHA